MYTRVCIFRKGGLLKVTPNLVRGLAGVHKIGLGTGQVRLSAGVGEHVQFLKEKGVTDGFSADKYHYLPAHKPTDG